MPEATTSRQSHITIRGARTHNLKNIDLTLPQRQLIVVTGVSGSGKSSLAFDTVYAEGQRRYVESLSAYARQFLERMEKPDVDRIEGICPAVAIRQKNSLRNPRSTVGTTTEILDYMRLLFARAGRTICRSCGTAVSRQTAEIASRQLVALPAGTRLLLGFDLPLVDVDDARKAAPGVESSIETVIAGLRRKGFRRILVDDQPVSLDGLDHGALAGQSQVRVVVDRVQVSQDVLGRVTDSVETCYVEGGGTAFAVEADTRRVHVFSERFECRSCKLQYEVPQPRLFSFNSPFGACPTCHGFGTVIELDMSLVVPDPTLSVNHRAIDPWRGPKYRSQLSRLKQAARDHGVRLSVPWQELNADEVDFIVEGGDGYAGIQDFFRKLEKKRYRVDVRAFLSRYRTYMTCPACDGSRLRDEARDVQVGGRRIDELCALTVGAAGTFFGTLALAPKEAAIAERILREITRRLAFLADVGLDYLTLDRLSSTLSGGEAQRINLATALGSALVDTLYVLDEPSIGLHPRDNERLVRILKQLRDQGNTVLVVEHDADMIRSGDYVVDLGPEAGTQGGAVVYAGPAAGLSGHSASLTAKYMRGDLEIPIPATRRKRARDSLALKVIGAAEHNLRGIDVEIPLNMLTCVTGVSGSGKSTLVHDVLYAALRRARGTWDKRVGTHERIEGGHFLTDVVMVDQAPIGRTPRSNPATYIKAFDGIRELFAATPDARIRGYTATHFSFNSLGGRCIYCDGDGVVRVEMQFLADVFTPCEHCGGRRFQPEVLAVLYRGRSIHDVLEMTVREGMTFFASAPKVMRRLRLLDEVGLGYLQLGRPATTLSGGEAQRIKIASYLGTRKGACVLFILDEPTTGLHFDDIARLLAALRKLLQAGQSVLVIEHNLEVIKTADWIIDLGPEGGSAGGRIVAAGSPETVAAHPTSHTARYLRSVLETGRTHACA